LIVSVSEEIKESGVFSIADGFQKHKVSLLDSDESDILHGLHEWQGSSICLSCLLLQMTILL
jgi:hypothetical protein